MDGKRFIGQIMHLTPRGDGGFVTATVLPETTDDQFVVKFLDGPNTGETRELSYNHPAIFDIVPA